MPRWLSAALVGSLLAVAICLAALWRIGPDPDATLSDYGPAPAFALTDQTGRPFSSEQLNGKVAVVGFIYTHCPDICPMLTAQMRQLQNLLAHAGLLGDKAVLVSITVDPERDTPEVLARYAEQFGADPAAWHFLTGDLTTVRQAVVDGFHLAMGKGDVGDEAQDAHAGHSADDDLEDSRVPDAPHGHLNGPHTGHAGADPYIVSHSGRLVLVDAHGRIRAYYDGTDLDLHQVAADIRSLHEPNRASARAYPHQEVMR